MGSRRLGANPPSHPFPVPAVGWHPAFSPFRDRIAIGRPAKEEPGRLTDIAGFAIWASVSEEVDAKIRDQIKAGTFPIRLTPEDWQSGSINSLLDVIAPDRKTTGREIANFRQVVKEGELRMHPQIAGLVETEMLAKMCASQSKGA
jgi:cytolysin-activating lysine-acyltransferase